MQCSWYWGTLSFEAAETELMDRPDGAFLVRDSSDDRYILSVSFRSLGTTHHVRIERHSGQPPQFQLHIDHIHVLIIIFIIITLIITLIIIIIIIIIIISIIIIIIISSSSSSSINIFININIIITSSLNSGLPQIRLQPLDCFLRAAARM